MKNKAKNKTSQPTSLVLFAGIGLVSYVLKMLGFMSKGAIDYADIPRESYAANFPDIKFWQKSVREISAKSICKHFNIRPWLLDLIQVSSPCTGWSSTGLFNPFHEANELFFIGLFLAFQLKPRVILFENVEGVTWEKM